jgi:hypothetical protein
MTRQELNEKREQLNNDIDSLFVMFVCMIACAPPFLAGLMYVLTKLAMEAK